MEELRCVGCGIILQCEDVNKEGYVHPNAFNREFILCKRCYQIKHYGKFSTSNEVNSVACLLVFEFSALKQGATSNIFSNPLAIAICL